MARKKKSTSWISRFKGILAPILVIAAVFSFTAIVRAHGGDSSLHHACVGEVNGRLTIVGVNDTCGSNELAMDWIKNIFAGAGLAIDRGEEGATLSADLTYVQKRVSGSCTTESAIRAINSDGTVECEEINSGWQAANETWIYASADDPTFTFTISGDKTGKYSPGMRVKLTQTSEKYFLITKVTYDSPNTTVTVYGGTDYDLANASISSPYYSTEKAPHGFLLDPDKWTVRLTADNNTVQNSPVVGTYYNVNTFLNLSVPIGVWKLKYMVHLYYSGLPGSATILNLTASTSNNSESDKDLTSGYESNIVETGRILLAKEKTISLTQKTTYYLNVLLQYGSAGSIGIAGDRNTRNVIEAVSAYL